MVKVTGGGRGMAAIAAHFRYISKGGRLPFEDDRGVTREGKEALHDLAEQWQYGGSFIDETSHRREAFNIMLSMPSGTDPLVVQRAAREFARGRARRPSLRDGPARPPSQPARAPQRARRVPPWQAAQSAQGRPAALARDLRGEAARLGHRRRGDTAGDAWPGSQLRAALAHQGRAKRVGRTTGARALEVESRIRAQSRRKRSRRGRTLRAAWPALTILPDRALAQSVEQLRPLDAVRHARAGLALDKAQPPPRDHFRTRAFSGRAAGSAQPGDGALATGLVSAALTGTR